MKLEYWSLVYWSLLYVAFGHEYDYILPVSLQEIVPFTTYKHQASLFIQADWFGPLLLRFCNAMALFLRTAKALTRLRRGAVWSGPLQF